MSREFAILLGILILQTVAHEAWFGEDRRIPFWDQGRYDQMTRRASEQIGGGDPVLSLLDLHPSHPPLYSLLGTATRLLPDRNFHAARRINLLLAALTTIATFALARRVLSPAAATLAAALTASAPLLFGVTHLYYIENLLVPWVLFSLLAIGASADFRKIGGSLAFGLLAGLGMLTKWTFPIFLCGPVLLALKRSRAWKPFSAAMAICLAVSLPWYVTHAKGILSFLSDGVVSGDGYLSGVTGAAGLAYYPKTLTLSGMGIPLTALTLVGALFALRRRAPGMTSHLLVIAIPILVFTFVLTKKPRHVLPLVPSCAILAAFAVERLPRKAFLASGLVVLLHTSLSSAHLSFAAFPPSLGRGGAGVPILVRTHNDDPGPPDGTRWPYNEILSALSAKSGGTPLRVLVLFNSLPFRDVGFETTARERGDGSEFALLPLHYPLGHPASRPFPLQGSGGEGQMGLLEADALLVKTGPIWIKVQGGSPVHRDAARVAEALLQHKGPLQTAFDRGAEIPLPDGSTAILFWRVQSPDAIQAIARFALRWTPDHKGAWSLLGVSDPNPLELFLTKEGVLPRELNDLVGRVKTMSALTPIDPSMGSLLDREDLLLRLLRIEGLPAAIASELRARVVARDQLALGDPASAGLGLAQRCLRIGDQTGALGWLRRHLEGGGSARDQGVLELAQSLGIDPSDLGIGSLRALEAARNP